MRRKKPVYEGKLQLKKNDEVIVLAGKDKGRRGKILKTDPVLGKVIVDGMNVVTRHQKPRGMGSRAMVKSQLGEIQMPMGLPVAKVMLVCPKCNKETRIARESFEGRMVRKCHKCGELVDA